MSQADFVSINKEAIPAYAEKLAAGKNPRAYYDTKHHFLGNEEETAAYILCLDSINFGSGYFPYLKKRPSMSGYFTVASCLKDWFKASIPTAKQLSQLNTNACTEIFEQELESPQNKELMTLFAKALNDLGELLLKSYQDSFSQLIKEANGSAEKLLYLLAEMPFFQDVALYKGMKVPFYKRAQITSSDLALALNNKGLGYFRDLDDVTIFADNLVPHVLHLDGILRYTDDLEEKLSIPIKSGSPEEIEIRAAALHTVELINRHLNDNGVATTTRELDMLLWNRGLASIYRKQPRHRTFTVFY